MADDIFDQAAKAAPKQDIFDQAAASPAATSNLVTGAGMEAQAAHQAKNLFSGDIYGAGKRDASGQLISGPNGEPLTYMQKAILDQANRQTKLGAAQNFAQQSSTPLTTATAAADIPQLGASLIGKIPRVARAAKGFADVAAMVGEHTVDVGRTGDVALRTKQLAESGGRMPKVVNDFLRRATDPEKGPITYNEARDFYSNATKLASEEYQRLSPIMQRQVTQFTKELGSALEETAARGGKDAALRSAMSEYSNAMKMRSAAKTIGKAAITGAGGYAGYSILKDILGKQMP